MDLETQQPALVPPPVYRTPIDSDYTDAHRNLQARPRRRQLKAWCESSRQSPGSVAYLMDPQ